MSAIPEALNTDETYKAFVDEYCEFTGFPNTKATSEKMLQHADEAMFAAEKDLKVPILASIYFPYSSVGYGTALPGSDIDGWMILVENDLQKDEIVNKIKLSLDRELVDPRSLASLGVITLDELAKYGDADEPDTEDQRSYFTASFLHRYISGDSTIREAQTQELDAYIRNLKLSQNKIVPEVEAKLRTDPRLIPKYIERVHLQNNFDNLSTTEKFLTIQAIRQILGITITERFMLSESNEFKDVLIGLCEKGILEKQQFRGDTYANGNKYKSGPMIEE